ncbi:transcription activator [Trypanosoma grayi]|uniref:transcription activator n=1 Tax=Trypanosoma grayi TaxID=71804 RepID=UPI0004F45E35|nr:transcription activator [Trypanosoma grayi]KEG13258.1 transcription activator [Trypanosoma grayi]
MNLDNPFAAFFRKRTTTVSSSSVTAASVGFKRLRPDEDALLTSPASSPSAVAPGASTRAATTDAAANNASPNGAEHGGAGDAFPTASASSSSPVKVMLLPDDGDEEEEELRLLLGNTNKVFVRPQAARTTTTTATAVEGTAPATRKNTATEREGPNAASRVNTAVAVGELPWATRSNDVREEIAGRFEAQFKWELRHNSELLRVFGPFFSDRALSRIDADVQGPQFLAAPTVTVENTAAAGGYTLRSYQLEGVQFLLKSFHSGIPCILADDMGLGKTAQIASFLNMLKTQHTIDGPHLVVAPLSTLTSWTRELARWAPTLRVVKYHGERKGRAALRTAHSNRHGVFVTTPSVLNQDRGFFRKRTWVVAVVDEAHVLKGRSTMISYVARKLTACFRLAVTGTPVHNNVGEVWSLVSFLYPSYCASYDNSNANDPVGAAEDCARLLQHIMLRRTKGSIELGIPPRVDEPTIMLGPTSVQQRLLTRMTEQVLREEGTTNTHLQLHLTHQRIVCNHPMALRLLATEGRNSGVDGWEERLAAAGIALDEASIIAPSAKMIELDRMLRRLKEEGHRCLIFSNFTSVLDLLQAQCVLRGYSFERLDGSTQRVERELAMIRFNAPDSNCFVFLLTTTAGGVGVTLTGADTVILFDAHYNPQIDRQAADRAHRIGQTRVVRVYRLCLSNTLEERILNVALRKASLGDFIVDGGSGKGDNASSISLSADRIRQLFEEGAKTTSNSSNTISTGTAACDECQHDDVVSVDRDTTAEDAMVEDLLCVEMHGLPRPRALQQESRSVRPTVGVTHNCFVCGHIMRPLEPLYHCAVCPKAYHADCVGERKLQAGVAGPRQWTCPRHSCASCGKAQAVDGAVFMCSECPLAFCFDCLDPRYFDLDDSKTSFVHIRRSYPGMEAEEMGVRRSVYYITCLRCNGVLSSSSSSSYGSESDATSDDGSGSLEDTGDDLI